MTKQIRSKSPKVPKGSVKKSIGPWMAPRLEGVVKNRGIKPIKKKGKEKRTKETK